MWRTLFIKKNSRHGKSVRCYQTFLWVGFLRCFCNYHVGRHVGNRLKVDKHGSGFLFSLTVLKRKAPIELGRHVEINLKLIHMAAGVKTHKFGRHVD